MAIFFNTDKISTLMGAPPNHWRENEIRQIKKIQKCFRVAYASQNKSDVDVDSDDEKDSDKGMDLGGVKINNKENDDQEIENAEMAIKAQGQAKDEEKFLPKDSPLRSKAGDKKAPANAVFKDYDTFLNSCSFENWRHHFDKASGDKFIVEKARAICSAICTVQSRNELRVQRGHVPFRKRREHITPLALTMHEFKLWLVQDLRTANPMLDDTNKEIRRRYNYIEGISHKEIWGASTIPLGQGMRTTAFDKLFRVLHSAMQHLREAEEYCYREYSRRSSREKLSQLGNALKDVLLNEMRVLSARFQIEARLEDAKTMNLQPIDLLNSDENLLFVDFKNPANVLLYKLFQNPLLRAVLNGDYEADEVKQIVANLGNWNDQNLFCRMGSGQPVLLMDSKRKTKIMPEAYTPAQLELQVKIRQIDNKTPIPDNAAKVIARFNKMFENEEHVEELFQLQIKLLAAVQEVVPSLYAVYKLWALAGDGGDYTVYDTMREHVIRVMTDTTNRVNTVKKASKALSKKFAKIAAEKAEEIRKANMKKGKMIYSPNWVLNHRYITSELQQVSKKSYGVVFKRLLDVAKDARDYSLTADQLSDKVIDAKKIFDNLTGFQPESALVIEKEPETVPVNTKKQETQTYNTSNPVLDDSDDEDMQFGANNNFNDKSSGGTKMEPMKPNYDSDDSE